MLSRFVCAVCWISFLVLVWAVVLGWRVFDTATITGLVVFFLIGIISGAISNIGDRVK